MGSSTARATRCCRRSASSPLRTAASQRDRVASTNEGSSTTYLAFERRLGQGAAVVEPGAEHGAALLARPGQGIRAQKGLPFQGGMIDLYEPHGLLQRGAMFDDRLLSEAIKNWGGRVASRVRPPITEGARPMGLVSTGRHPARRRRGPVAGRVRAVCLGHDEAHHPLGDHRRRAALVDLAVRR